MPLIQRGRPAFPGFQTNLQIRSQRRERQTGTAFVEMVLSVGFLVIPIFFGVIITGLSVIMANQVTEVCRDVGHMFAYGVDFSQSSSKLLVTNQLAQGLNMTPTGGSGVIYLSILTYVNGASCTAAGYQANSSSCPNMNQIVVIKRLVIGNASIHAGSFAPNITPGIIGSDGDISSANYLTDTSVQASGFSSVINLGAGQLAYLSEMFVNPPSFNLWALFSSNIITARSIF